MRFTLALILMVMLSGHTPHTLPAGPGLVYLVREPKVASTHAPLLLLLHGVGSNEEDLFGLSGYLPGAFRILSLRAPITLSKGSYAWYRLDYSSGVLRYEPKEAEAARTAIVNFIVEAKQKYHAGDVYLMGFSQGAIMSYSIALTRPDLVKGILTLSGRMLDETKRDHVKPEQLKHLSVFCAHGTNDPVLNLKQGKDAADFCRTLQMPVSYHEYPAQHEITQAELNDIVAWLQQQLRPSR